VAAIWTRLGAEWDGPYKIEQIHRASVLGISMTITLGVPPLLFVQILYAKYFYSSSISIGFPWLAIVGYLLVGFYSLYLARWRWDKADGPSTGGKAFTIITAISLVLIGFTYSWNHVRSLSPTPWAVDVSHFDVLLRLFGYGGAVAAASAAWAAWFGPGWRQDGEIPRGAAVALIVGAVFLTIWTFQSDHAPDYSGWMGQESLLGGAVAALVGGVFGFTRWKPLLRAVAVLASLGALIGLTLQRESYRLWKLAPDYNPDRVTVDAQWSPFVMFLIAALIGIGALIWLLIWVREAQRVVESQTET